MKVFPHLNLYVLPSFQVRRTKANKCKPPPPKEREQAAGRTQVLALPFPNSEHVIILKDTHILPWPGRMRWLRCWGVWQVNSTRLHAGDTPSRGDGATVICNPPPPPSWSSASPPSQKETHPEHHKSRLGIVSVSRYKLTVEEGNGRDG